MIPTAYPTTSQPTSIPTVYPSEIPTLYPSDNPTVEPTLWPSGIPTFYPSSDPTFEPTGIPSSAPSNAPTFIPIAFDDLSVITRLTTKAPNIAEGEGEELSTTVFVTKAGAVISNDEAFSMQDWMYIAVGAVSSFICLACVIGIHRVRVKIIQRHGTRTLDKIASMSMDTLRTLEIKDTELPTMDMHNPSIDVTGNELKEVRHQNIKRMDTVEAENSDLDVVFDPVVITNGAEPAEGLYNDFAERENSESMYQQHEEEPDLLQADSHVTVNGTQGTDDGEV